MRPLTRSSRSREQLSIKTKERDGRSPLPLAGRPVSPVSTRRTHSRQFVFEPRLLRSSAVSSVTKFSNAKGFSFVPILEDPALVLCFYARAATSPGLLRSRKARSVLNRDEILSIFQNSVTVIPRNAYAGRFEILSEGVSRIIHRPPDSVVRP
ncbi:hypothetical protein SFRURICE_019505 [Spodoptera frugiperda]|uniref:SFRICE_033184 n=1 Tax=Spodoptera frugiperda TaxID=7108 RepID=A0A2H1X137_SPOFR|nr:hypothetical protein SFRURICE_019505 [Spodoptera frugiperda]